MKKILPIYLLCFVLLFALSPAKGQEGDFKPVDGAREGYLPCGIKYYTLPTPWIKGKLALGMVVNSGNLYETQEEVGIAHFLEHLCSTSVLGFDREQSLQIVHQGGLNLFTDWQAFTSDTRTVYNYTYPENSCDTEEAIVRYLKGVLSDMVFTQEKVEVERAIILKEMESSYTSIMPNLSGGYFERHSTVGDSAQICAITPAKIDRFYRKWYRPDNIALVMIGDATGEELERKLQKALGEAHCVVDSVMAPAFLPIDQSNVNLYNPAENKGKSKFGARLIFRFPLVDMARKSELRRGIALEMVAGMLQGMLETDRNIKVSRAIPSNMPRAAVINVMMECRDTAEFRLHLEKVGQAVSRLRFGEVGSGFLSRLWQTSHSVYKSRVKNLNEGDTRAVLSEIYGRFCGHLPLADEQVYAAALDEAAATVTAADIHWAAETAFTGSRAFLGGFPDYGKEYEQVMGAFLDSCCACPKSPMELKIPQKMQIASKDHAKKILLRKEKPVYSPELAKKQVLANGMELYRFPSGLQLIWDKTNRQKRLLVHTHCGFAAIDPEEKKFMEHFGELRFLQVSGIEEKELEMSKRAWEAPRLGLKIEPYRITIDSDWEQENEEYIWQYLASIYTATGVDEYTYRKGVKNFKEELKKGSKTDSLLTLEEVNNRVNRMLVPAQTRIYLQGDADIRQVIAYVSEIPTKKRLKMPTEKIERITQNAVVRPEKSRGKTLLVNRVSKEPVKAITLKSYLIHNMLEEYMSRMLMLVIREEKGLIYSWGTTPYCLTVPEPHTSLSLRFRIVPELLDLSLEELQQLCEKVAGENIDMHQLKGLKRREWNRYLDLLNEPEEVMPFVARQMDWNNHIWTEGEIRRCLDRITLNEVNQYFRHYLSLPAVVTIKG